MIFEWDFFVFAAALGVAAFSPGPGLAAVVATVLASGARKTIWFCVGVIVGDLVWLMLSVSGLAIVAQQYPSVFIAIKWSGVAYLIYLAIKLWKSPVKIDESNRRSTEKCCFSRILSGFSITMGNPKAMLFYIALLPSLVDPDSVSIPLFLSLMLAVVVVLTAVFSVYIFAAIKARNILSGSQSQQNFKRVTATALGGAAVWIATK